MNAICQNCNEPFERNPIIDGKRRTLKGRLYCFQCSPFKSGNSQKIENGIKLKKDSSKLIIRNQEKKKKSENYDWEPLQRLYDSGETWNQVGKIFNLTKSQIDRAISLKYLKSDKDRVYFGRKPSEETKNKIRKARLSHLEKNPTEKSWREVQGKDSGPCKFVKDFLLKNNISFTPELQPLLHKKRYFSIDIAFIKQKIAWEINGNQHYDTNGNLKPYYQTRHELIEQEGWTIIEIRYWNAYKESFLWEIIRKYNLN